MLHVAVAVRTHRAIQAVAGGYLTVVRGALGTISLEGRRTRHFHAGDGLQGNAVLTLGRGARGGGRATFAAIATTGGQHGSAQAQGHQRTGLRQQGAAGRTGFIVMYQPVFHDAVESVVCC